MTSTDSAGPGRLTPAFNWKATLRVMVVVQCLMAMGQSMANPLVPLFLAGDLGLELGRQVELWSGAIVASGFLTMAVFSPFWGNLADRYGRKMMVLRSTAAIAVANTIMAFVASPGQLLTVRLCMGMLSGYNVAATALIGAIAPRDQLGYALGMQATGRVVGLLTGPLVGGALSSFLGYRPAFAMSGFVSLAAFILVFVGVREAPLEETGAGASTPPFFKSLAMLSRSRGMAAMFPVLLLSRISVNGITPIVSLYVTELDVAPNLVPLVAGLAVSVTGLGAILTTAFLGRLADRSGPKFVLILTLVGSAVFFLPQAFVKTAWQFLALRFAVGLFNGGVQPAAYSLVGRLAPPNLQSSAYGMTATATSFGSFSGPLISAGIAAGSGLSTVFVYSAILIGLNAAWVGFAVPDEGAARKTGVGEGA